MRRLASVQHSAKRRDIQGRADDRHILRAHRWLDFGGHDACRSGLAWGMPNLAVANMMRVLGWFRIALPLASDEHDEMACKEAAVRRRPMMAGARTTRAAAVWHATSTGRSMASSRVDPLSLSGAPPAAEPERHAHGQTNRRDRRAGKVLDIQDHDVAEICGPNRGHRTAPSVVLRDGAWLAYGDPAPTSSRRRAGHVRPGMRGICGERSRLPVTPGQG